MSGYGVARSRKAARHNADALSRPSRLAPSALTFAAGVRDRPGSTNTGGPRGARTHLQASGGTAALSGKRTVVALGLVGTLAAGGVVAQVALGPTSASADPSASTWQRLRICESSDNYQTNTGNGYYGAYQFDLPTWRSVGGTGLPSDASPAEQDYRALYLYRMRGWEPWECATILGLQDDS